MRTKSLGKRLLLVPGICLALSSLSAAEPRNGQLVSVSLGGGMSLSVPFEDHGSENFHPVLETRARVMWFDFALRGEYTRHRDSWNEWSLMPSIGFCNFDARRFRLSLDFGPRFRFYQGDGKGWYNDDGDMKEASEALDYFSYSPVAWRIGASYLFSSHVVLSLSYQYDTKYRFEEWERVVDLIRPDWETGRFGVTCSYLFDVKEAE